jgi:hypothetical protein
VKDAHLDDETLACFFDNCLSNEENERIKEHIISCDECAEILAISLNAENAVEPREVPRELLSRVTEILKTKDKPDIFEIVLLLKENILEIISATGDILLGQELIPAPILRSRKIKDFKDEVIILKDFEDIRLEVKVENKGGKHFNVTVKARHKHNAESFKDLRATLIKDGLELESYFSDWGEVTFEHVLSGKYDLELTSAASKLASVTLEVRT